MQIHKQHYKNNWFCKYRKISEITSGFKLSETLKMLNTKGDHDGVRSSLNAITLRIYRLMVIFSRTISRRKSRKKIQPIRTQYIANVGILFLRHRTKNCRVIILDFLFCQKQKKPYEPVDTQIIMMIIINKENNSSRGLKLVTIVNSCRHLNYLFYVERN